VLCEISYWLCLVLAFWLKLMMPCQNRGPPVGIHTRLCCSVHACIRVSSHNPLWDYINMLSLHKLFLPREIHYWWCSTMVSWLRTCGTTTKLRAPCECTRKVMLLGACWYRGPWSWSIVELHWCVIFRGLLLWNIFLLLLLKQSNNLRHHCWIKRVSNFDVFLMNFLPFNSLYQKSKPICI
jgi:hypothetical protein